MRQKSLQSSYRGEHKMKLLVGYETTSSYSFQSIHWAIPISVTSSPRVRSKITPYDTNQSTLMSPRFSMSPQVFVGQLYDMHQTISD